MPTVTHFLQKGHTFSNRATPPNSDTPWAKHIQTTIAKYRFLSLSQSQRCRSNKVHIICLVDLVNFFLPVYSQDLQESLARSEYVHKAGGVVSEVVSVNAEGTLCYLSSWPAAPLWAGAVAPW